MYIYKNHILKMNDDIAEILLKVAVHTITLKLNVQVIAYDKKKRGVVIGNPWPIVFYLCYYCLLHISLVLVISDLCSDPLFI